jgi:nitrite reductase/ring-hydroxylating ferredoxin subunit
MSALEIRPEMGAAEWLRVASLEDLQAKGVMVIPGVDRPIAVFAHEGGVSAVDNRCPHLGFPLHRGTVKDGILTCHWHHARFDLCSGCTFDLFADDVPAFDVEVRDGEVFVRSLPRQGDPVERYTRRLREGMEQNISLIQAKSIVGLLKSGVDYRDVVRQAVLFGTRYRDGWRSGLTILTAMANLVPYLEEETAYLAIYQGVGSVAADCERQTPRRDRYPLETEEIPLDALKRWLAQWTTVRHRDGAERTVLTAVHSGASKAELTDLLFTAATQRFYADGGHVLDFCNKSFEVLDLIGWDHAEAVLPTVLAYLVSSRGGQEVDSWRGPIDLVPPLNETAESLPELLAKGEGKRWDAVRELAAEILGEDPLQILAAMRSALADGATPEQLCRAVAYASAQRIARFGTANEFADWITALHTFTYCSALHQAVKRCPTPGVLRGAFHGAVSVYLDRFLNVPPALLPGERDLLDAEPTGGPELLERFLDALNQQQEIDGAARSVARYLQLGHPAQPLFDALTRAVVREDAEFHTFQMVEAAIRQYEEWGRAPEAGLILIAAARYIAAHSPTQRAQLQTAQIALRLHRGESLYEDE